MKNEFNTWEEIPKGMCIIRMSHERIGKSCLHLHLKVDDGIPWYDQPRVPCYSEGASGHTEFWKWAVENLPIWNYPTPVKAR